MILCSCKAISDQHIHQALREGVRTVGEISARWGVGTECGQCLDRIREVVDAGLSAPLAPPAPVLTVALNPVSLPVTDAAPAAWFAIDL